MYSINTLADAARMFGDHREIGPLVNQWYKVHFAYLRHPGAGNPLKVRVHKKACLDAIAKCGVQGTFRVERARDRGLRDEIFPPGCGPKDKVAA